MFTFAQLLLSEQLSPTATVCSAESVKLNTFSPELKGSSQQLLIKTSCHSLATALVEMEPGSIMFFCLQTMTDVVANPEEERRAEFYYQPWAQEAVCRYFYSKVTLIFLFIPLDVVLLVFRRQSPSTSTQTDAIFCKQSWSSKGETVNFGDQMYFVFNDCWRMLAS